MMKAILVGILLLCWFDSTLSRLEKKDFGPALLKHVDRWHTICRRVTGASEDQIDRVYNGTFPEGDDALQRYTYCIWNMGGQMDLNMKMDQNQLWVYIPDMHKADFVHYMKCNADAIKLPNKNHVQKVWEMQKCVQKSVDNEHYIFF
ncbi:uncharacterized protein LOC114332597 [Diabrotica virgifera virgifera]|uniref:Uncharacterized protein LOC114332597 n=1 Tax=Diabrotica virgifera virgifera TaxID=50390 RepID=A0A6P7G0M4_DIAVI|nr:uncharacterized protein LOC114332597 [Diabrotica virgifera virgifera]XP_028138221.1 uncharacterized protein LOC114332597 [Diabrotica virgifera virgifera]